MSNPRDLKDDIFIAAAELRNEKGERLTTGSKSLDDLFGGGIEASAVIQFYGAPGSWKIQLCYTLYAMLPSQYNAIYIDTEGTFCPERIESIAKARRLQSNSIFICFYFHAIIN
jgi:DNA repair protein RadA